MARSLAVACLAFAGVFVLAGAGWALLAGALLVFALWRREPDWAAVAARGRAVAARALAAPRRVTAATGMPVALVLLSAGAGLAAGAGAGLMVAGGGVAGVALLTGWGA
jgi:hypothetical protein